MPNIQDITATNWSLSLEGFGKIVSEVEDIGQCILIICTTQLGSDPLRPGFGFPILKCQDKPLNMAIPNYKLEIVKAVNTWEKRVTITKILHTISGDGSSVSFEIIWQTNYSTPVEGKTVVTYGIG